MRGPELNWQTAMAPSLDDIDALARQAFEEIPAGLRAMCGDVVIIVQDFADDEMLTSVGMDNPLELSGLFTGVALPHQSGSSLPRLPNTVHLFRLPILMEWAEEGYGLGQLVSHILIHEIGHHFGFSDDGMHAVLDQEG